MNWQDYLLIATVLFNVYQSMRHQKLTKAGIEKALYGNRQLLGKLLSDIVAVLGHEDISGAVTAVEQIAPQTPAETAQAHAQAGAHE